MKRLLLLLLGILAVLAAAHAAPAPASAGGERLKGFMLSTASLKPQLQAEIEFLADRRATAFRFPIYVGENPSPAVWYERIDNALEVADRRAMTAILDMHDHPAVKLGDPTDAQEADFVSWWAGIARRYASRPSKIWYDLGNEPGNREWRALAARAAAEIRKVDTTHRIVLAPRGVTTVEAPTFRPLQGVAKQALEFHFYNWPRVQFDGRPYPSAGHTRDDLFRLLSEVRAAGDRNGVPVLIGEVAITRDHPNAARFLRDFTQICDELGIDLIVHAFRESDLWDYEGTPAWSYLENWLAR